ncbi:MurR/RpiR family transcriptional regulator [Mammaliicoccus sciuri]|uniref:MurR/RpiR family transcriptional regulator n=1 Tax=Mammaliicoccus sciuri TaxID=1296 RepID=UPI001914CB7C|nr:MurR/RpiR family transcriptional regulator [Mammaliicoccus sciuri]MBU6087904.1 MurR/RpiR family transcriptional regulator [Mammaliicoccus sciuri]MBW3107712.1 MurR/RpiR family transcriptional regulator [Mammaliicoccus sciuri]MCD8761409.1 MurR/RpiR family transcriptional regulator [Mammaliicoccus sciuri]MCD8884582.1 MurR/RpiR family transcriptional regulator [Mammaliicoccus sciuri]MCH5140448.1 MurR/RpiR family transcriptional regulator [Mammaliicoccus sciuri]
MNFENRIQQFSYLFTKSDEKIARFILDHPVGDHFSTITSLAYAIGVSTSSITRFSHKLNYQHFQDMKFNIQQTYEKTDIQNVPLIKRIHEYHQTLIQQTGEFISNDKINQLIDILTNSRQTLFAGLGSSGLTATEFYYRTMRMGIAGSSVTDAHQMKIGASLLNRNDALIAFSNSGKTEELINAAKIAKSQGATVIAITNYAGSELTAYSDIVIMTIDQTRVNDKQFINTQISAHFLIDVVSYILLERQYNMNLYQHTRDVILKDNKS